MTNLDNILKSRDVTLPTKVRRVRAIVFQVVMYRCESWTVKKAEHRRIDAFKLWRWRRLLRVPWTASRSNQSNPKEEQTHWKKPWCWEKFRAGWEGGNKGWDSWMASPTQSTWVWASSGRQWRRGKPGMLQFMGSQSQTQLSNWTTAAASPSHTVPRVLPFFLKLAALIWRGQMARIFPGGWALPWWLRRSRICLQGWRPEFDPWVGKISWRRECQPTLVFFPGESHRQRSQVSSVLGVAKSWKWLSN